MFGLFCTFWHFLGKSAQKLRDVLERDVLERDILEQGCLEKILV
jgi:hypothetical protein